MQFDTIDVQVDGSAATLLLDRPEKLNPLSVHTLHELEEAARWLDRQPDLKVVVVGGRGRAFSSGADVGGFGGGGGADDAVPGAADRRGDPRRPPGRTATRAGACAGRSRSCGR